MELERRKLGRTDVSLTVFGFGGTSLGNMYRAIDDKDAIESLDASFKAGVRYVDTAPLYGHGLSEHRVGGWLRKVRGEDIVLSTKVGWRLSRRAGNRPKRACSSTCRPSAEGWTTAMTASCGRSKTAFNGSAPTASISSSSTMPTAETRATRSSSGSARPWRGLTRPC